MKCKLYVGVLVLTLMCTTVFSFAETLESYEISDLSTLKEEINLVADEEGQLDAVNVKEIVENTSPQVIEAYRDEQEEKLKDTLDGKEFTMDDSEIVNGVEKQEFDIVVDEETDAKAHIILEDRSEPYEISLASEGAQNKTGTSEDKDKLIGDRYFTGSCYYQNGLVAVRVFVENHYTVTPSLGLKERYLKFQQAQGMPPYCEAAVRKADDGHVMNASGVGSSIKFKVEVTAKIFPMAGGALSTFFYYADSKVKILKKISGGLNVRQSLTWDF